MEYLFVARRLLDQGSLELAEPGVRRVEALPWLVIREGEPVRTRLLPATPVTLVPLLALDRWLGLEDPLRYGRLVHLQGHLFVVAGLAWLAAAVRAWGASERAAAVAVVLTGLTWPVWLVARRIGPEPILLSLVCLFLAAEAWSVRKRRRAAAVRLTVCAALPWVSPTGSVIGLALAAATLLDAWLAAAPGDRRAARLPWSPALGVAIGAASFVLLWNRLYHGDWWLGGYAPYAAQPFFGTKHAAAGLLLHLRALALEGPLLLLLAAAGLRATGAPRAHGLTLALMLTGALLVLFASFYQPEPARRLAVVWPAFGAVVGRTWDSLKLRAPAPQALLAAAGLLGFHWLIYYDGRRYPGPAGLFYPNVLWVERILSGAPAWQLLPAAALAMTGAVAAAKTWQLLRPRTA